MTPTTNLNVNSNTCWKAPPTGCTSSGSTVEIAPGSYGNITSNSNLHLSAGTYYINSLNLNGGSVTLDSVPVVINLGGNGINSGGTLFASQSNTTINSGGIPANLQIVTACCLTGTPPAQMATPPVITMNGSSTMYAVVYAQRLRAHNRELPYAGRCRQPNCHQRQQRGLFFRPGITELLREGLVKVGKFFPGKFRLKTPQVICKTPGANRSDRSRRGQVRGPFVKPKRTLCLLTRKS